MADVSVKRKAPGPINLLLHPTDTADLEPYGFTVDGSSISSQCKAHGSSDTTSKSPTKDSTHHSSLPSTAPIGPRTEITLNPKP